MNTVHRQFGKLRRKGGDQANVAMLLNEYEDADKMLTKVCGLYSCMIKML
jgi:amphiphysin